MLANFHFYSFADDLLSSTLNFGTIYHNKFINADEKERVLISFCFQPNPPVMYCVYVECMLVIK